MGRETVGDGGRKGMLAARSRSGKGGRVLEKLMDGVYCTRDEIVGGEM